MAAQARKKLEMKAVQQLKAWSKEQASLKGLCTWGGFPRPRVVGVPPIQTQENMPHDILRSLLGLLVRIIIG